jgi:Domain of unknown function (DUF4160)
MPVISRFLGIAIRMFYREHGPPHFHASYGEHRIVVSIQTGAVEGHFPPRAFGHVMEWYHLHRQELVRDWQLAEQGKPLEPIPPLE